MFIIKETKQKKKKQKNITHTTSRDLRPFKIEKNEMFINRNKYTN